MNGSEDEDDDDDLKEAKSRDSLKPSCFIRTKSSFYTGLIVLGAFRNLVPHETPRQESHSALWGRV